MSAWVYLLQRISALVMAPLVVLHIIVICYAIQGGLTADEILARTRGSLLWGSVYAVFTLAAAVHAGIGVRNLVREWLQSAHVAIDIGSFIFSCVLLTLGIRAVVAVTGAPV